MAVLFVRHKVADFATWKNGYDAASEMQKANGVRTEAVYRHEEDPNEVTVYHEFDSMEKAKAFANNPQLKDIMADLGVKGKPEIWFTHQV